jgi:hypothetical protein
MTGSVKLRAHTGDIVRGHRASRHEVHGVQLACYRCGRAVLKRRYAVLIYTFYGVARVPVGDDSDFQWVAVMPPGLIFVVLTLPAPVLALKGHWPWVALVLGCAGLVAFALLCSELLTEFYHVG